MSSGSVPRISYGQVDTGRFTSPGGTDPVRDQSGRQMQQTGQAIQQAGEFAISYADRLQDQLDDAQTREADALLSDAYRQALKDPKNGYLNAMGKSAIERRQATVDALDKARRTAGEKLSNDRQREMFGIVAQRRQAQALEMVDTHAARQMQVYEDGQTVNRVDSAMADDDAFWVPTKEATGFGSGDFKTGGTMEDGDEQDPQAPPAPQSSDVYWNTAVAETRKLAENRGLSQEESDAMVRNVTSQMHTSRASKLLRLGHTTEASTYVESAIKRGEMQPDQAERLRSVVQRSSLEKESLDLALELSADDVPLERQLVELDRLYRDGDITAEKRNKTLDYLRERESVVSSDRAKETHNTLKRAQQWQISNRGNPAAQMDPQLLLDFERYPEAKAQFDIWKERGQQWITTSEGLQRLTELEIAPGVLKDVPWEVVAGRGRPLLDDAHMNVLAGIWADANQKPKPKGVGEEMMKWTLRQDMARMGLMPEVGKPDDLETARYEKLRMTITERAQDMAKDGPVTREIWDAAKEIELGNLMQSDAGAIPFGATLEQEKPEAYYRTSIGMDIYRKHLVEPDTMAGLMVEVERRNKEIEQERRRISLLNATLPEAAQEPLPPLIGTSERELAELYAEMRRGNISERLSASEAERERIRKSGIEPSKEGMRWLFQNSAAAERLRTLTRDRK